MVALAIFAVSITALSGTFHSNVRNAVYLKNKTLAHWIAQNEMVQLRAQLIAANSFPAIGDRRDKREFAGRQWIIRTQVIKTPVTGMNKIEISVGADSPGELNELAILEGYLSDPN
jgi:general secretion pathway protein I